MSPWPEKAVMSTGFRCTTAAPHDVDGFVTLNLTIEEYEHAAKCVNSHDRLVEMVQELLHELPKWSHQRALIDAELEKLR